MSFDEQAAERFRRAQELRLKERTFQQEYQMGWPPVYSRPGDADDLRASLKKLYDAVSHADDSDIVTPLRTTEPEPATTKGRGFLADGRCVEWELNARGEPLWVTIQGMKLPPECLGEPSATATMKTEVDTWIYMREHISYSPERLAYGCKYWLSMDGRPLVRWIARSDQCWGHTLNQHRQNARRALAELVGVREADIAIEPHREGVDEIRRTIAR